MGRRRPGITRVGGGTRAWSPRIVAAAYRPLRCVEIAVSAAWPSEIDRDGACWRYGMQLTAVLRDVDGVGRTGLAARRSSCPDVPLPPAVRARLGVCAR